LRPDGRCSDRQRARAESYDFASHVVKECASKEVRMYYGYGGGLLLLILIVLLVVLLLR